MDSRYYPSVDMGPGCCPLAGMGIWRCLSVGTGTRHHPSVPMGPGCQPSAAMGPGCHPKFEHRPLVPPVSGHEHLVLSVSGHGQWALCRMAVLSAVTRPHCHVSEQGPWVPPISGMDTRPTQPPDGQMANVHHLLMFHSFSFRSATSASDQEENQ